jgi:hypothetical protein
MTTIYNVNNAIVSAFALPQGYLINGLIQVSVTSNNLTVAIKGLDGNNPSASNPVYVRINNTIRAITAALSVTKNAGTNWCNSGSAELATKEIDYFVYLIWNTTPATDIIDIGFSRIPYARVYSEFSGTSTNEAYLAQGNASTPTSTDDCVVIGRFAATLSAGAGYTWSVPTFTTANLIQRPIFETRWLDFAPVHSRTGTNYTNLPTQNARSYRITYDLMILKETHSQNATPGGTGDQQFTIPWTPPNYNMGSARNVTDYYVMTCAVAFSSNLCLLKKYDGTTDVTASKQYDTTLHIKMR